MDKKTEILSLLTDEWKSTTWIKNQLKINWYIAAINLMELNLKDKVDRMETARSIFWRLKND